MTSAIAPVQPSETEKKPAGGNVLRLPSGKKAKKKKKKGDNLAQHKGKGRKKISDRPKFGDKGKRKTIPAYHGGGSRYRLKRCGDNDRKLPP